MNLTIVCGARPNFIKVAPLIRLIDSAGDGNTTYQLVYTGSADDPDVESSLFSDLGIKAPSVFLDVVSTNINVITGQVMAAFEDYLSANNTDCVVVVDDLASTMGVSIVTKKKGILLAHIAAGTRSFDITMPKEINRLVIDGLSDILFTAGISNNSIANREGAELSKVYMVGNILMDNLRYVNGRKPAGFDEYLSSQLGNAFVPSSQPYVVLTINRRALIADSYKLLSLIAAVTSSVGDVPVIAPLRQNAHDAVVAAAEGGHTDIKALHFTEPMGYCAFTYLTSHAAGIITDSGNVAEEATFNQVPCVTLNSYTEHIETVKTGTNVLVGENPDLLAAAVKDMVAGKWKKSGIPDRWDGRTAARILQILNERVQDNKKTE